MFCAICYHLYNLKKGKKHPWRIVTFITKVRLLHGCFSRFLNFTNGAKSRNESYILSLDFEEKNSKT